MTPDRILDALNHAVAIAVSVGAAVLIVGIVALGICAWRQAGARRFREWR